MGNVTTISIVIPTYYRKDGSTITYLKRAIDSIFNQTYQNFKIYLIGDKYEKEIEILEFLKNYDERIFFKNLEIAKERDIYNNKSAIWSYGGVNATNNGIEISLSEGNYYICHLDHDDYWKSNHLELIVNCINSIKSDWICTKSVYINNRILPTIYGDKNYIDFLPKSSSLIRSSVCINFKTIPLRYRDIYNETGVVGLPSDADLWERCREHIIKNNLKSTLINEITCYHIEEGSSKGL
jgi:glycosyltransferase involved in cell wall biosynthesis